MKRGLHFFLALVLILATAAALPGAAVFAASEQDTAADCLKQNGILEGDDTGNLKLDSTLTRAELAAILTRLDYVTSAGGLAEWKSWGITHFADPANRYNTFTDLPDWALPYIEYCYERGLMKNVGGNSFDPQGQVNPRMACTVILRYCGFAETDWSYDTSVAKAQELGIAPGDGLDGEALLRGTMAVILYRGMDYTKDGTIPSEPPTVTPTPTPEPSQTPQTTMTIDEMKDEIVRLTNEECVKAGLMELKVLPELMDCAQAKAQDFLDNHYYGHTSPRYGTAGEMIKSFVHGVNGGWENLTFGPAATADAAMNEWMNSAG